MSGGSISVVLAGRRCMRRWRRPPCVRAALLCPRPLTSGGRAPLRVRLPAAAAAALRGTSPRCPPGAGGCLQVREKKNSGRCGRGPLAPHPPRPGVGGTDPVLPERSVRRCSRADRRIRSCCKSARVCPAVSWASCEAASPHDGPGGCAAAGGSGGGAARSASHALESPPGGGGEAPLQAPLQGARSFRSTSLVLPGLGGFPRPFEHLRPGDVCLGSQEPERWVALVQSMLQTNFWALAHALRPRGEVPKAASCG